jgi:hypothetical protein
MDQPVGGSVGFPLGERHLQSVEDELGAEMISHRPADDPAGEEVLDVREIEPALPRADVGDVRRPRAVRRQWVEVALHEIGSDAHAVQADGGASSRTLG